MEGKGLRTAEGDAGSLSSPGRAHAPLLSVLPNGFADFFAYLEQQRRGSGVCILKSAASFCCPGPQMPSSFYFKGTEKVLNLYGPWTWHSTACLSGWSDGPRVQVARSCLGAPESCPAPHKPHAVPLCRSVVQGSLEPRCLTWLMKRGRLGGSTHFYDETKSGQLLVFREHLFEVAHFL